MAELPGRSGFERRIPIIVLVLILLLTLVTAAVLQRFVIMQQQARFDREIDGVSVNWDERLHDYTSLLLNVRSFWEVQEGEPTQHELSRFVDGIALHESFPGVLAIGFARLEGDQFRPQAVIRKIAPFDTPNRDAIGFDMYAEELRRDAIQRADARNIPQVSRPVKLVQRGPDGKPLIGSLIFLPVNNGSTRQGFLYLALDNEAFISSLMSSSLSQDLDVRLQIASADLVPALMTEVPKEGFTRQMSKERMGQRWDLYFTAPPNFGQDIASQVPRVFVLMGIIVAAAAFLLARSLAHAKERSEEAAFSLSKSRTRLQRSQAEFAAIFDSMLDPAIFTYPDGNVRLTNAAFTEQFGYRLDHLQGQSISRIHTDQQLSEHQTFSALSTPYQRQDGSVFAGEGQRSAVNSQEGELLGYLEVVRDVTERQESEQALRASEQHSREVMDVIPHLLWLCTPELEVTYANALYKRLLPDGDIESALHPADREAYAQLWEKALKRGRAAEASLRLRLSEGYRYFMFRTAPVCGAGEAVSEWVGSATDIHDRYVAERLAQLSEERYRGVLEGMPQIVWLASPDGEVQYFNRRWSDFLGTDVDHLDARIHPDDREDFARNWREARRHERPFEAEHRLLNKDGEYCTFVTRGLPIRAADGQVIEWVGTSTDVDTQVYAENASRLLASVSEVLNTRHDSVEGDSAEDERQRQQDLHQGLDLMTRHFAEFAALWVAPPHFKMQAVSRLPARWEDGQGQIWEMLQRLLFTEDTVLAQPEHADLLAHLSFGGLSLHPLFRQDGSLQGVLGVAYRHSPADRDIELSQDLAKRFATALDNQFLRGEAEAFRRELQELNQFLEERVAQRTAELQEANKELEAFSYSVSHDLRTPLRHIIGFADLLKKDLTNNTELSPKSERYLGVIGDSASRMSQLIDDLLEFSRVGRREMRMAPVDLDKVMQEAWNSLEPDRGERAVRYQADALPPVLGDASLLGMVFTNLLSNALKYSRTREETRIEVRAQIEGREVTVSIRDNGVGFDPKYTEKLFGVFQRLHRAEEFEGTGIGLANVRRIVVRHGGRVWAETVPDEGATFFVALPLASPSH